MPEFCSCGSIIINGNCSNRNCALRAAGKPESGKKAAKKTSAAKATQMKAVKAARAANPRRASKCITYNLYDKKEKEENLE